jgi:S-DNA-T family DNA segregation ATPase FtsK/SpoIIIE
VADVPALLRALAPDWAPYKSLNGVRLRRLLEDEYQVRVPSTGNRFPLDPAAIRTRIAERRSSGLDESK